MSAKSKTPSAAIRPARFGYAFAAGAFALGILGCAVPAHATTTTWEVQFNLTGTYNTCQTPGDCTGSNPNPYPYGSANAVGDFFITFDYMQNYVGSPSLSVVGSFTGLNSIKVFDTYLNPVSPNQIPLDPILYWQYAYGTLTLSSDPNLSKNSPNSMLITVGVNGWSNPNEASGVWYSQDAFGDTITANGSVQILQQTSAPVVPLPAALPLFASGLGAMGLIGWRKRRKGSARAA